MVDSCEHGNELWGFRTGGRLLNQQDDYKLLKKNSAPWSLFVCLFVCLFVRHDFVIENVEQRGRAEVFRTVREIEVIL
jgi:hypothetical protein